MKFATCIVTFPLPRRVARPAPVGPAPDTPAPAGFAPALSRFRLGILLLCAGLVACGSPTAAACEAYVAHVRDLPCASPGPPDVDCRMYDGYPCDGSGYFACAIEAQVCDETGMRDGLQECAALSACP